MNHLSLTTKKNFRASQKGAAAVEFAIVISLLVLIVGGIIEFGRVLWHLDALTKATRDGARFLATVSKPISNADKARTSDIVENAATKAGLVDEGGSPLIGSSNVAVSCDSACDDPGYVTVAITGYGVDFGSWFAMPLPAVNWPLQPQTTMRYMCTEIGKSC